MINLNSKLVDFLGNYIFLSLKEDKNLSCFNPETAVLIYTSRFQFHFYRRNMETNMLKKNTIATRK